MRLPGWLGRIGDDLRDAQVREWGWNGAFSLATRQFNELICLALWMTIQYMNQMTYRMPHPEGLKKFYVFGTIL